MSRSIVFLSLIQVSHSNMISYERMYSTKSSSVSFLIRPLIFHAIMRRSPSAYSVTSRKFPTSPSRTSSLAPDHLTVIPAAFSLSKIAFMSLLFCSTALVCCTATPCFRSLRVSLFSKAVTLINSLSL